MLTTTTPVDAPSPPLRHAWIARLAAEDAQTLLWHVCTWIEDPTVARGALTARITRWQQQAQDALRSQVCRGVLGQPLEGKVWGP